MSKTPEEYFQEQSFSLPGASDGQGGAPGFSSAELTFIRKYMGLGAPDALRKIGLGKKAEIIEKEPEKIAPELAVEAKAASTAPELSVEAQPAPTAPIDSLILSLGEVRQDVNVPKKLSDVLGQPSVTVVTPELTPVAETQEPQPVPELTPVAETPEPQPAPELTPVAETPEPQPAPELTPIAVEAPEPAPVAATPELTPAAVKTPEPKPEPTAQAASDSVNASDLAAYKETIRQQFEVIHAALEGLKTNSAETVLVDALFRSLVTVQNSSNYMGFDEVKVYAERTAGLINQSRKSGLDFALMQDLATQETDILHDMTQQKIDKADSALVAAPPASVASVAPEAAKPAAPAPEPELTPVAIKVPAPAPKPVPVQEAAQEPVKPSAPVAQPSVPSSVQSSDQSSVQSSGQLSGQPAVPEVKASPDVGTKNAQPVKATPAPEVSAASDKQAAELAKLKAEKLAQPTPAAKPTMADIYDGMDIKEALDHFLRNESELQMVAFYVGDQEFTVPTVIVQEVIHYSVPVKLPIAPPFVAGVINLRGKVTPLVHLRDILEIHQKTQRDDRFIVICRYQGLQIGLIIERVHSMYRVTQKDIDWGIEAHLGINVDYVSGLLKQNDQLIGIIAVDKIVTDLLSDDKKQ